MNGKFFSNEINDDFTEFINNLLGNYLYSEKEKKEIQNIVEKYIFEFDSYTNRIKIIEELSPIINIKKRKEKLNKINEKFSNR
jgi:hypothetical protein